MGPRGVGGGGVETEVSCLRRWLAEEDRSRGKKPSPVCVFVCWVIHQGLKRGRGGGGVCVSRGGVTCGYYFEQRRRWDKCEGKSDHFWVCFSCVSKCKDSNHRPLARLSWWWTKTPLSHPFRIDLTFDTNPCKSDSWGKLQIGVTVV